MNRMVHLGQTRRADDLVQEAAGIIAASHGRASVRQQARLLAFAMVLDRLVSHAKSGCVAMAGECDEAERLKGACNRLDVRLPPRVALAMYRDATARMRKEAGA